MEVNEHFATVSQGRIRTSDHSQRTGPFHPMPITAGYTDCSVNDTPNFGRYVASLEVVQLQSKTSNRGMYYLQG